MKPVLVIGGGITGIQTSLDLANRGIKVHLIEKTSSIGGVMSQLDKTFPTNDCSMCILAPKMIECSRNENIKIHTMSEVIEIKGEAGDFKVKIIEHPRSVDVEKCTGCGICSEKCPIKVRSEYQSGTGYRKAIYLPFPQAVPLIATIDRTNCLWFSKEICRICEKFCPSKAINYDQVETISEIEVASIVLAQGAEAFNPEVLTEYGYGVYPNVVTSLEFERIMSATGPFNGQILRSSDKIKPKKIAFLQCIGSRDSRVGNSYCSSVCCMYAIKEAVIAQEHDPNLDTTIFFIDIRAFGKEFEDYYTQAEKGNKIRFIRSRISSIEEIPETKNLEISYESNGEIKKEIFDMIILSVGLEPPKELNNFSLSIDLKLNKYGFVQTENFSPVDTSLPGIYVAGVLSGPKDIPDSISQASAAAVRAASNLRIEYEETNYSIYQEKNVEDKIPRIGVFVCHCGTNIGSVVDVPSVVEYVKNLPNVIYAEENLFTCSQDTQKKIIHLIKEHELNRIVVASCSPRTHEALFQATLQEAGLNPYLFEMANIRDQCSWVHMHEHEKATQKAKDLVRMAISKARLLKPLTKPVTNVTQSALVIGGGISGITAALEIADQGYLVHLVEKEGELGGNFKKIKYLPSGDDPEKFLKNLKSQVSENKNIITHLNSKINSIFGYLGNFESVISKDKETTRIKHGVVIVATGGLEYKPKEYLYGTPGIITQLEFEELLSKSYKPESIVMIQCVGSRCEERSYCSRICCTGAISNALKAKELNPDSEIFILFKDIRTYGFKEDYYREAAEKGIIFIRYDDENKPEVSNDGKIKINVLDPVLKQKLVINPEVLVLSSAIIPQEDSKELSGILKVPLSKDGFFLEAHMKLRPLDFATEGIFLCGLAHAPKTIDECISQALGAAARSITILSKKEIETEGVIAIVDEKICCGCQLCLNVCEYNAIEIRNIEGKMRSHIIPEICKGCGVCAATCPSGAITIGHFTDDEILSQIKNAFKEVIA
ncbi:CoB--CoM heterodisulfide reductase iron-sulfur subunit A family protein [Candidatus Bathyarchaeota archaeon]|nr:CoB--CoM heterodisulfide reductase iron-sulfur subunit A family protein [Candidatus Bathyarchaeota archaeon]